MIVGKVESSGRMTKVVAGIAHAGGKLLGCNLAVV